MLVAVAAEMTATVWRLHVATGQAVRAGETLVTLESMKMEIPLESPVDGVLAEVLVAEGGQVIEGDIVARIQVEGTPD